MQKGGPTMATGSTGVYGGVDYNTADAATKKKLVQTQMKLNTDPNFKQSETARALQAIRDREASGLDTSAQRKYLTSNLGYTGAIPAAAAATATAATGGNRTTGTVVGSTAPTPTPSPAAAAQPSANAARSSELMDLMRAYATRESTPFSFSYNPETDPEYKAALARARTTIDAGNSQAQAEMNRRGILNSTITSDRMGEIASQEMGRVETDVLPQLNQQAYSRAYQAYADQQAQEQQRFQSMAALAQMYNQEDQRGIDNRLTADQTAFSNRVTEAGLTGNYLSGEAEGYINQLLALKQQAESPGITAAERSKLSNQADGIRARLQSLGVDSSKYGANVSAAAAGQARAGVRTLQGQQLDAQNREADRAYDQQQWANRFDYGRAIGKFGNGQQTLEARNMAFNQGMANRQQSFAENQQNWQNQMDTRKQNFTEGQQAWENSYNEAQFALNDLIQKGQLSVQQANLLLSQAEAVGYVTPELSAATGLPVNQQLMNAQQLSFQQDNATWDRETAIANAQAEASKSMTPQEYAKQYINPIIQREDGSGAILNKNDIIGVISNGEYTESQMESLFKQYQITDADIEAYRKTYGLSGN